MGSSHVGKAPIYSWVEAHPPATSVAPGGGDPGAAIVGLDLSDGCWLSVGLALGPDPEHDPTITAAASQETITTKAELW